MYRFGVLFVKSLNEIMGSLSYWSIIYNETLEGKGYWKVTALTAHSIDLLMVSCTPALVLVPGDTLRNKAQTLNLMSWQSSGAIVLYTDNHNTESQVQSEMHLQDIAVAQRGVCLGGWASLSRRNLYHTINLSRGKSLLLKLSLFTHWK